jgi:hypothetical protein
MQPFVLLRSLRQHGMLSHALFVFEPSQSPACSSSCSSTCSSTCYRRCYRRCNSSAGAPPVTAGAPPVAPASSSTWTFFCFFKRLFSKGTSRSLQQFEQELVETVPQMPQYNRCPQSSSVTVGHRALDHLLRCGIQLVIDA